MDHEGLTADEVTLLTALRALYAEVEPVSPEVLAAARAAFCAAPPGSRR